MTFLPCANILKKLSYVILITTTILSSTISYSDEKSTLKNPSYIESPTRAWVSIEYLQEWIKDGPIGLPLITTSTSSTLADIGALNSPGTQILYGSGSNHNAIDFPTFNGGRITLGAWLDQRQRFGIEADGLLLAQNNTSSFQAASANTSIITIPFKNTLTQQESSFIVSFPGVARGSISVDNTSRLWGWDLHGLVKIAAVGSQANQRYFQLMGLAGLRALALDETFALNYDFAPGANLVFVNDNFKTRNHFYGAEFGARGSVDYCGFTADLTTKIALGRNFETQYINGQTDIHFASGAHPIVPGGLFALTSNIGTFNHNQFALIPEIQAKLGYRLTPNFHPYIGYNFLYMNHVIRPGDQLNRNINRSYVPTFSPTPTGSPSPLPVFHTSSYWAQGVNLGLEINL